ncbi:TRAP-type transporter, periplasmic solute binding receptor (TAXI family protein) [Desulfamplus magnetovallimortis]|uniref:TRAP-type transporter, periplasmic solute binding receptor (TAXI family protein) n=1 Tax=Desulfamplus magnetovallimortis TaxID=1246637 RepID=A0A1W1HAN8_9BACT|nr:TAXI family TRAP transporter solute-binding subunit [Desulfamplus magnetovallimortis]SLM29438.1 TRAP-type transporter, periplasmic solute binding receptor (TAXI family protein) [Desulfamplus magnetovallimortis]
MKRNFTAIMAFVISMIFIFTAIPLFAAKFVTIGTGGITGVYYPTGGAIAKIVNKKKKEYGIRCTVESTGGSVFNVNAVMAGDLEFGVVQSDRQYQAINGIADWEEKGKQEKLRAVFSIHPESCTLLAAVDAGINTITDLKGKRVNMGNFGSGHLGNSSDALKAIGFDLEKDVEAEYIKAAEAPGLLQDGRLDAFFYTVGHPSGAFKEATAGARKVKFIAITGPGIDKMIESLPYYAKSFVPVENYPGAENDSDVDTFGVKATLVTSADVSDDIVYAITKEVFENFDEFKKLHPAYKVLTKKNMLEGLSAPIHPGAMKYYKEAGLK